MLVWLQLMREDMEPAIRVLYTICAIRERGGRLAIRGVGTQEARDELRERLRTMLETVELSGGTTDADRQVLLSLLE